MQHSQHSRRKAAHESFTFGRKALIIPTVYLNYSYLLPPSNKLTMPLIRTFFFILGFVVASVEVMETSTAMPNGTENVGNQSLDSNNNVSTTALYSLSLLSTTTNITSTTTNLTTSVSATTSTMSITNASSAITPLPTKRDETFKDDEGLQSTMATPKPMNPNKITPFIKTEDKSKDKSIPPKQNQKSDDSTGIIIVVVIVLVALGFGVICYIARRRGRRHSVDFTSRPDEANIPLSTMEPELHIDTVSQNGLQTFESVETAAKEPQEPEAKPEVQEEQKAEAEKSAVEPSAESAAPAPILDSSEDKPKDDVTEQSPPAPVEPRVEEKTDDEGVASTKTSVESLKETNQNNSNNADFSQKWDLNSGDLFWDVPLNCPL